MDTLNNFHSDLVEYNSMGRGVPKDLPTLEIRAKLADLGLDVLYEGPRFGKESMLD